MAKKATNAEIEFRIATLYEMVVKGATYSYIVRYASEEWDITSRQTDTYLKRVYEQIKDTYDDDYKKRLLTVQLAKLDELYQKNYTIQDFRECRNVIETINKMIGLDAPTKTDITTNGRNISLRNLIDFEKTKSDTE